MLQAQHFIRNSGGNDKVVHALLGQPEQTILLDIAFDYLDWSRGERTKELDVEVLTEYYIWDAFAIVGTVGGQMGLFISFSFIVGLKETRSLSSLYERWYDLLGFV